MRRTSLKIAFVDHYYHQLTNSSRFFRDLIASLGHVDVYWETFQDHDETPWQVALSSTKYDLIVIWQWSDLLFRLPQTSNSIDNVIWVPMYDQVAISDRTTMRKLFRTYRTICFSKALFEIVSATAGDTILSSYYPDPTTLPSPQSQRGLRGFFWRRTPYITETTVASLCGSTPFDKFTVHLAPDPGYREFDVACPFPIHTNTLHFTSWFESRSDYLELLAQHNIYFASRHHEGIGMGFLEAMAAGLCVVAPDTPTHNEYIDHGFNGLLYGSQAGEVELSAYASLGSNAARAALDGYARWRLSQHDLLCFIA
jgi:hypothetical protein